MCLSSSPALLHAVRIIFLGCLWCGVSASLISFNKSLMHQGRFPYPTVLVLLHMMFSSSMTGLLFCLCPTLFPALGAKEWRSELGRGPSIRGALAVAVLFSASLVTSNAAYIYSSVTFLQMMKEGNIVLIYLFSLLARIEPTCWQNATIILCIVAATSLTIHGEVHFSPSGFVFQALALLFGSSKLVVQAVMLSPSGLKLDVLSYILLVNPLSMALLGLLIWPAAYILPGTTFDIPSLAECATWAPILVLNCAVALVLNFIEAELIKTGSAVTLNFTGIVKDCAIVGMGTLMLKETVTPLQVAGFCTQISLVLLWSLKKTFPEQFEGGVFAGIRRLAAAAASRPWSLEEAGESRALRSLHGKLPLPSAALVLDTASRPTRPL